MNLKISFKRLLTTLILLLFLTLITSVMTIKPLTAYAASSATWGYQGEANPQNWGQFSTTCAIGKNQSPININLTKDRELTTVSARYQPSLIHILNNGHTVMANYDDLASNALRGQTETLRDRNSYIVIDDLPYEVKQFHYHSPSEHTLNGQSFPAELHIVHQQNDKYAVVGILLKEGKENLAYKPFIDNLPSQESPEIDLQTTINLAELLPTNKTAYSYNGSLTTPPCTEGVYWLLMTNPVELSPAQIKALQVVFKGNNRPLQLRN